MSKFNAFVEEYKQLCLKHKCQIDVVCYDGVMGVVPVDDEHYKLDFNLKYLENHLKEDETPI